MSNFRRGPMQTVTGIVADSSEDFTLDGYDLADIVFISSAGAGAITCTYFAAYDATNFVQLTNSGTSSTTIAAAGNDAVGVELGYADTLRVTYTGVTAGGYTLVIQVYPYSLGDDS